MITIVLLVLAIVCFILSAAGVSSRVNLQSLGLVLFTASFLLTNFR